MKLKALLTTRYNNPNDEDDEIRDNNWDNIFGGDEVE